MSESLQALAGRLGPAQWSTDPERRALFALDVYGQGEPLVAVLRPDSVESLREAIATLTGKGVAIVARGGGLSYTDAYLATRQPCVAVDLGALERVIEINAEDRYVRVQAGCSWAALDAALAPHGLRTPYWGPLSGLHATVGGALSQHSAFLGSAQWGSAADSVLGLRVVSAAGELLGCGALAGTDAVRYQHFGPDLLSLFLGDCGALGVKVEACLKLIERPPLSGYLSWQCDGPAAACALMSAIARSGIASECFGFDPVLAGIRLRRAGLANDARTLGAVVRKQGLLDGLRLVGTGRDFLDPARYSVNAAVDACSKAELAAQLSRLRTAVAGLGDPVDASIPRVLRSQPFAPPNSMLGPDGERWVPVHGILPHSQADAAIAAVEQLLSDRQSLLVSQRIVVGRLLTTIGAQALLYEPVLYWPDAITAYHRSMVEPAHLARLPSHAEAPQARQTVAELKREIAQTLQQHGAVHFQVGKFYRWREQQNPVALALFDAIRSTLDPQGLMNPGVLP